MGGYGSGRPGRRPVNDNSLALSFDRTFHKMLAELQQAGSGLRTNTLTWSRGGTKIAVIGVLTVVRGVRDADMILSYVVNGESIREVLHIEWTQTAFGWRPWWLCPGCKQRVLRLYNPDGPRWRCRRCYDVTYTSSNESDKRLAYTRLCAMVERGEDLGGYSAGALILTMRAYDRIRKKVDRDLEYAQRHPGTVGRPRKDARR